MLVIISEGVCTAEQFGPHFTANHMSSMTRILDGAVLVHHLTQDERMIDPELLAKHGRSGRTLVKDGPLRLTMMGLAPGGVLPSHSASGPVTIHVLEGEVVFTALERDYPLAPGDVLVIAPDVMHSARSTHGGLFLLTVIFLGNKDTHEAAPADPVEAG